MGYSGAHYMDSDLIMVGGGRRQKYILSHLKESGMWRGQGQVFQVSRDIIWEDPEIKENEIVITGIQADAMLPVPKEKSDSFIIFT